MLSELMNRLFVGVKQAEGEVEPGMEDGLLAGHGKQLPSGPTADALYVPDRQAESCPSKREQVIDMDRGTQGPLLAHCHVGAVLMKGKRPPTFPYARAGCDPHTAPIT